MKVSELKNFIDMTLEPYGVDDADVVIAPEYENHMVGHRIRAVGVHYDVRERRIVVTFDGTRFMA